MDCKYYILILSSQRGFGYKIANTIRIWLDEKIYKTGEKSSVDVLYVGNIEESKNTILNTSQDRSVFYFIMPEFNGSYPAPFKQLIDDLGWPNHLENKECFLVGYSGSFSGNVMGCNHIKTVLDYVGAKCYPQHAYFPKNGDTFDSDVKYLYKLLSDFNNINITK